MWLFVALVAVPIIEIALFIEVGGWLGLWPTIAIVILTAVLGTMLLRHQGLAALAELQRRAGAGEDPSGVILHGLLILIAGIVLLTPGFFTDAIGFALLVPPVREALIGWLGKRIVVAGMAAAKRRAGKPDDRDPTPGPARTIDGEWEVLDGEGGDRSERPTGARPSGWTRDP